MPRRLTQGFWGDLKLGARRLLASPLFTIFAVMSIASGVAVTTAVYSVVDSIFLKDSGIRDPEQMAFVVMPGEGRLLKGSISEPDFRDFRDRQTSFRSISASASFSAAVALPSTTVMLTAEAVDAAYFATLGVPAAIGRVIQAADANARVAVLSHRLWRTSYGADPTIVGNTIRISGRPFEVIGVAQTPFEGARGLLMGGTSLWVPLAAETSAAAPPSPRPIPPREHRQLMVFGRLGPASTAARASGELAAIAAGLDKAFPPLTGPRSLAATARPWRAKSFVEIAGEDDILDRVGLTLVVLVGLVLVVACTNLANLVLARGTTRQRELAVRRALGASRWRLVREQSTESLLIVIGGGMASYVCFQALRVLMSTDFNVVLPFGGPWTLEIRPILSRPALYVAVGSLLISLVAFGIEPALRLTRTLDIRAALAAAVGVGNPRTGRQQVLLRWQVAIATGFFVVATMFLRFTVEEARHDSGVELGPMGVATLNLRTQQFDQARVRRMLDGVLEEGRKDLSVEAISISTGMPYGVPAALRLTLSRPEAVAVGHPASAIAATPSIFKTLGVPILRGRGFDDRDHAGAEPVVVLSEHAARQILGTVDAVGQQLAVQRAALPSYVATVIGVAQDTDVRFVLSEPRPFAYVPLAQHYDPSLTFAVRSRTDATRAVGALRAIFRLVEPDLAVDAIGTGRAMLAGPFEVLRSLGIGVLSLGLLTLLLAMVGLFGIQSHVVAQRTREIGVRMAVGASAAQIQRMVLTDGFRPVFDGLVLGLVGGLVGRILVRAYMDLDVAVVDPWILIVTPIPPILAAACACYLPARRAAGVDPNVALRTD